MKDTDFIGLTKKGAQNLAEANNLIFRLVSIDGENYLGLPEETIEGRVCIVLENGKVTTATFQ